VSEPTLRQVLDELDTRGLLQRTTAISVGAVAVQLAPAVASVGREPVAVETADERRRRLAAEADALTFHSVS